MNPTKNKKKGAQWETDVVNFLKAHWPRVERRRLAGSQDKGDTINGPEDWTIEAKNEQTITLSTYMKEAAVEAKNAGTKWYAAVVKARGKNVKDAYVVMPLEVFVDVCIQLEKGNVMTPNVKNNE